jgi:acetyltransferase-like isoleucine patch superfamily enzyme
MPTIHWVHRPLWWLHHGVVGLARQLVQQLYYTPLFKSRLRCAPKRMQLYSGMPQVGGSLNIDIGEGCRISGISSLFGRSHSQQTPELQVGENVDIGWQCTLAVGRRITLGDNVRLAGRCYLAGFPGHPEDPVARAQGLPETENQVGDICLEDNVWLATGVTVLAGVTIGKNSIIGTGSVVTQDIPPNVIAAGIPAKVLRPIDCQDKGEHA